MGSPKPLRVHGTEQPDSIQSAWPHRHRAACCSSTRRCVRCRRLLPSTRGLRHSRCPASSNSVDRHVLGVPRRPGFVLTPCGFHAIFSVVGPGSARYRMPATTSYSLPQDHDRLRGHPYRRVFATERDEHLDAAGSRFRRSLPYLAATPSPRPTVSTRPTHLHCVALHTTLGRWPPIPTSLPGWVSTSGNT